MPRDCDPEVAAIPGVSIVDIDGLRGVVDVTLERRRQAIPMVEEIIAEHTERFKQWYLSQVAVPVINSLVQRAELIRKDRDLSGSLCVVPISPNANACWSPACR